MSAVKTKRFSFFPPPIIHKANHPTQRKSQHTTTQKTFVLCIKRKAADKRSEFLSQHFAFNTPFDHMDSAQWMQDIGQKTMGEIGDPNASSCTTRSTPTERKVRPQKELVLNCPRCHSTNTKFCYYNNYSLTQPRYFCKTCRRYWTEGGTLRSVPVGGGSRKNKRSSNSNSSSLSNPAIPPTQSHKLPDLNPPINSEFSSHQNPKNTHPHDQGQDLNLGYNVHAAHEYSHHGGMPQLFEFPKIFDQSRDNVMNSSSNSSSSSTSVSALNLLRNGIGFNSFIPIAPGNLESNMLFASNFQFNSQECKPTLGFSFDGINNGSRLYVNQNMSQENVANGSLGFPFGATKRNISGNDQGTKGQENSNGYWNGTLGGQGSW